jgi:tripartite-type tricarboxylate transporter receptor subunit TctC
MARQIIGERSVRFTVQAILAIACCVTIGQPAWAAWPEDKPIEIVVGFAPGGSTDVMARKLAQVMQKRLGEKVTFVIANKPGASGEIALGYLARAVPDGYTIGVVNVPSFLFVPMTKKAQYDPADFRLIARVVDDPTILLVKADSRFASLADLVKTLKEKPGSLTFGHNGTGTNGHLAIRQIDELAKVEINEIPYKGNAAQRTDLLGGHLDVAIVSTGEVPELHGGNTSDTKAIVQLTKARSKALPNVPTAEEAGVAAVMSSERGFAAPKGVPDAIVKKLETVIAESLRDPEFVAGSPGDAPVLAYLPGADWQTSLADNAKALRALVDKLPK